MTSQIFRFRLTFVAPQAPRRKRCVPQTEKIKMPFFILSEGILPG